MAAAARGTLLALLLTFSLSAHYLINDHLISPKAGEVIEKIGTELQSKTGIHAYVIASNDQVARRTNLYDYVKRYEKRLTSPWAVLLFLPNSKRIGLLVSDSAMRRWYDGDEVKRYAVDILGSADKNSLQSKYDVAMVQAYSELADELAKARGVELRQTIKNEGGWLLTVISWMVYLGAVLVFWVYFGRSIYARIRHGR